jgi:hypothetical protein
MSKGIEKRFNDTKLLRNKGKGKEFRKAGKLKKPGMERQGEEGQSEASSGRIASVAIPPKGTEEESQERCRHTEDPLYTVIPS